MKKLNNTFAGNTRHFNNEIDLAGSEGLDGTKVDNNSEDVPSVCRLCMPECQRCHSRLNESVQGLEQKFSAVQEQPSDTRCVSCAVQAPTNDQYLRNSDRAEHFRRCFFLYARTCMPICQRCLHDFTEAVPAQYELYSFMVKCQRHFQHQRRVSDPQFQPEVQCGT